MTLPLEGLRCRPYPVGFADSPPPRGGGWAPSRTILCAPRRWAVQICAGETDLARAEGRTLGTKIPPREGRAERAERAGAGRQRRH